MSRHAASLSPLLGVMTAATRKAAHAVLRDFREVEHLQVSIKGPADFVTSADMRAEEILREELARARPHYDLLAEESGFIAGRESADGAPAEHCWVIDAIDGTLNFLHGLPSFALSVALSYRGEPVCGIVYDPVPDELFYGEKGKGAYLNGKRLRVSARSALGDALVAAAGSGRGRPQRTRFLCELSAVAAKVAGVRHSGSSALNLAYLAAGRFDAHWERDLHPWDIAAGMLLVREAGGIVSEPEGGDNMLQSGAILAANSNLHRDLAATIRKAAQVAQQAEQAAQSAQVARQGAA